MNRCVIAVSAMALSTGLAAQDLPTACRLNGRTPDPDVRVCRSATPGSCDVDLKVTVTGGACSVDPPPYRLLCVERANEADRPRINWRLTVTGGNAKFAYSSGIVIAGLADAAEFAIGKSSPDGQEFYWLTTDHSTTTPLRHAARVQSIRPCTSLGDALIVNTTR